MSSSSLRVTAAGKLGLKTLPVYSLLTSKGRRRRRRSRPSPSTCSGCSRPPPFRNDWPPVLRHSSLDSDSVHQRTSRKLHANWRKGRDSKHSVVALDALLMSCRGMRRLLGCDSSQTQPSPRRQNRNAAQHRDLLRSADEPARGVGEHISPDATYRVHLALEQEYGEVQSRLLALLFPL